MTVYAALLWLRDKGLADLGEDQRDRLLREMSEVSIHKPAHGVSLAKAAHK